MKSQITKLLSVFACICLLLTAIIIPASAAETSATISFADKANRTAFSTTQQVWEQNGIKVTNNKAGSTNAVGDYADPGRFYKSSEVIVEYPGMTKLVIDSSGLDSKYVAWDKSFSDSNATATVDGGITTITFATPVDSFKFNSMSAQCRAFSMTVYAVAAEEPEECKHIGGYAASNGDETHNIVCDSCEEVLQTAVACTDADADGKCDECLGTVALPDDGDNGDDTPAATEITLTVNSLGLASNSYSASTATVDGVDFEWEQLGNYGNGIQVRDNPEKGTSIFWNTTAFGAPIKEIKLVFNSAKSTYDNPNAEIFSFGNAAGTYDYSTELSTVKGTKEYTITPNAETYTFLKFEHNINYTFYWDSITIILAGDDTTGGTTPDEPDTPVVPDEPDEPVTPVEPENKTIAEVLAMEDGDTLFYVTAEIVDTYRDTWATYGNFILKDDSTEDTIIMYGLNDQDGNRYDAMATKPVVGDTIKVLAKRSSYNGVGQLANAVLIELIPGETPETPDTPDTPDTPVTPVEPENKTIAEVLAMEDGDTLFYVTAEIVDTYRDTWATYGNFILKDDSTEDTIIMYGLNDQDGNRYDAMATKPVVGDTVKVLAKRSSYNGVGQLANAVLIELIPGDTPETPDTPDTPDTPEVPENSDPAADSTLTIEEAIALGNTKDKNAYTEGKYYITGKITAIASTTYGNMYIADEAGNEIYVYGTYGADGKDRYDALEIKPVVGDTVTLYGVIGKYNDVQMKNAWIIEIIPGDGAPENTDPAVDTVLSIKDAIALGASKKHDVYTEGKYYITGTILEVYNEQYGNLYLVDAEGNQITVYGTWNEDGTIGYAEMENKPVAGDTVTLYGVIGQYNGVAQMKNGWFKAAPTTDDDNSGEGEGDVTTPDDDTNGDNGTTSPVTGDNVGAVIALSMAAAAAIICTKKRR